MSLPLASLFGPDAISYRLSDSGAKAAIVHPANRAKVEEAAPQIPVIETGPEFDALCSGPGLDVALDTAAEDPAYLIYTSGTTGAAQGSASRPPLSLRASSGFRVLLRVRSTARRPDLDAGRLGRGWAG